MPQYASRYRQFDRSKALSEDEFQRLIQAARTHGRHRDRDYTLLTFCGLTGLRVGELVQVRFEDVHHARGTLVVNTEKQRRPTLDEVHIEPAALELVQWWGQESGRSTGWMFPGKDGNHISVKTAQDSYYRAAKAAGINVAARCAGEHGRGPHALRHYFAVKLMDSFEDPLLLKQLLRDRSLKAALVYSDSKTEWEAVLRAGCMVGRKRMTIQAEMVEV